MGCVGVGSRPLAWGTPAAMAAHRPISETLFQYGRSVAGGLLFAVASMYTMEIWWQGYTAPAYVILTAFLAMLVLLVAYAHYDGFEDDNSLSGNAFEAMESVALGFAITAIVLKLVGQLPPQASAFEIIARITMVGVHASIGVAVGTAQLGASASGDGDGDDGEDETEKRGLVHDVALAVLGAILIGSSVAPTEEIVMVAVEARPWQVLAVALLSLGVAAGIVSYVDFRGSGRFKSAFAGGPLGGACATYAFALLVAGALLWAGGRYGSLSLAASVDAIVILGLPCTLGASAGRMLL